MQLSAVPPVEVSTLIRRPVAEVFAAFVDPALTTRFWFTTSSGALAPRATVQWECEMYGAADTVRVKGFEAPKVRPGLGQRRGPDDRVPVRTT